MADSLKDKVVWWLMVGFMLVILVVGAFFAWPEYMRGKALARQSAELDRQIAAKQREIAKLEENQRRFNCDRDFVEHIARQHRRVFPGEIIFVFGEDDR